MMSQDLPPGTTTALKVSGKLRVQTTFPDKLNTEMVEEWTSDKELHTRRWRQTSVLGRPGAWEYEIGSAASQPSNANASEPIFSVSSSSPSFLSLDSPSHFLFHVTNAPWPVSNYKLSVDAEKDELLLRTHNKKYFKRFRVGREFAINLGREE